MNKQFNIIFIVLVSIMFFSCGTTVKIRIEYPPLVDVRNMETITVIPVEWKDNGRYNYLARDLTRTLTRNVRRSEILRFIEPECLRNIDRASYWEYVDVYLECEILDVTTGQESAERRNKDNEIEKYTIETATVNISYRYISAINNIVLASFHKDVSAGEEKENRGNNNKLLNALLSTALRLAAVQETNELARKAVRDGFFNMDNEINFYTTTERRNILQSTNRDPAFRRAERFVRQKKYNDALIIYRTLYEETGSAVACYNMAILLQVNNQFMDALVLLEDLFRKLNERSIEQPGFLIEEIRRLRLIVYN
ncbi:MAG: hypothetical protein LBI28_02705 [Treponema sp.]|jgi:hypothetical protein|nr:hypothetical protein [Treponema sp.]